MYLIEFTSNIMVRGRDNSMITEKHPTVFWDFDGTLAYREGFFVGTLVKILDEYIPGLGAKIEDLRPHLNYDFPWHKPDVAHPELSTPEAWWYGIEETFARAFEAVGVDSLKAKKLARLSHEWYVNPLSFILYDDTIQTLEYLQEHGWRHIVLSNHVPELPQIVEGVGLGRLISECISSANVGFEKPNPEIFRIALKMADHPENVWMVGDRVDADVRGAEAVGIRSILVRSKRIDGVSYYAGTLTEVANIIHPSN